MEGQDTIQLHLGRHIVDTDGHVRLRRDIVRNLKIAFGHALTMTMEKHANANSRPS